MTPPRAAPDEVAAEIVENLELALELQDRGGEAAVDLGRVIVSRERPMLPSCQDLWG